MVGPPNAVLCNAGAIVNTVSSASIYSLVNGVAGKNIYVCGWHVTVQGAAATTSPTFALISGAQNTVTPCATGVTSATRVSMTPSFSVASTAPATDHVDYATLQVSPSGAQLCIQVANPSSLSAQVWFSQF